MKEKIQLSNEIIVTDPCYGYDLNFCQENISNMKPGIYTCEIEYLNDNSEQIVKSISITCDDYEQTMSSKILCSDSICVDSGQAGFFDYDFYKDNTDNNKKEFYDYCCNKTLSKERYGIIKDKGFIASSGFGDGVYNMYSIKNDKGEIVKLEIIFIEDDEIDEE